jgi:hypothetical protein
VERLAAEGKDVAAGRDEEGVTPLSQYQVPRPDLGLFNQLLIEGEIKDGR